MTTSAGGGADGPSTDLPLAIGKAQVSMAIAWAQVEVERRSTGTPGGDRQLALPLDAQH